MEGKEGRFSGLGVWGAQREFSVDNLLVRIHLIIEMTLVDWPCAMGVLNSLWGAHLALLV